MKQFLALLLCIGIAAPGCAAGQARLRTRAQALEATSTLSDQTFIAEFARQLRVGTRVRATLTGNRSVRGTLLKTTDKTIVIQPKGRIAEPVMEVPLDQLLALEEDVPRNGGTGRALAIGAAAGAGAALGVLLILAAIFSD
jgi:hypothetical protein